MYLALPLTTEYGERRREALNAALRRQGLSPSPKPEIIDEPVYGNKSNSWTELEDQKLLEWLRGGASTQTVRKILRRSVGAVYARWSMLSKESEKRSDQPKPQGDFDPDEAGIDKHKRYRRRNIQKGLCSRCGKPAAPYRTCETCRKKKQESRRRRKADEKTTTGGDRTAPTAN